MQLVLPPGISAAAFDRALADFGSVVGDEWVFASDEDRDAYIDHFALTSRRTWPPPRLP